MAVPNGLKRWLSAADGQQLIFGETLNELHNEHATLNLQLLEALHSAEKCNDKLIYIATKEETTVFLLYQ